MQVNRLLNAETEHQAEYRRFQALRAESASLEAESAKLKLQIAYLRQRRAELEWRVRNLSRNTQALHNYVVDLNNYLDRLHDLNGAVSSYALPALPGSAGEQVQDRLASAQLGARRQSVEAKQLKLELARVWGTFLAKRITASILIDKMKQILSRAGAMWDYVLSVLEELETAHGIAEAVLKTIVLMPK